MSPLATGARPLDTGLMDSGPLVLILFAVVVVLSALALWRVGGRLKDLDANRQQSPDPSLLLLQREIEAARNEVRQAQSETLAAVRRELAQFSVQMNAQLGQVGSGVQQQLQHVGQVVGEVQGSLGKLGEVTQRVFDIGKDIAGLEQILRSPKVRGGLGESFLEGLLAQMLPREHFAMQHAFATGDRVDAVVKIGPFSICLATPMPAAPRMATTSPKATSIPNVRHQRVSTTCALRRRASTGPSRSMTTAWAQKYQRTASQMPGTTSAMSPAATPAE